MRNPIKAFAVSLILVPGLALAAGAGVPPLSANVDLGDSASLQRGAKYFVNYCSGCHGLSFMRFNRMGTDLGIPEDLVAENLLYGTERVVDKMRTSMRAADGEAWFGIAPPDLSVIARSRGPDWLYTYLVTFYRDTNPARPFGVNNIAFPDVGMPHVMWSLQGVQEFVRADRPPGAHSEHATAMTVAGDSIRVHASVQADDGEHHEVIDRLDVVVPGSMSPGEYRRAAQDLTAFLTYAGEPAKLVRYKIGFWVLIFLAAFFVLTRALYKEFWRDVH